MKYFKTEATRTAPRHEITPKIFEEATGHKHPFEQVNSNLTISQYGICPSCLNPIQLIGIAKQIKVRPYGKHTGKNIPGFPKWNHISYEYCPYASKNDRRNPNEEELLPEITEEVVELYELLKSQFDRVVYIISQELDIRCSLSFWEKALKQYLANDVYCYPWLTEANLPYIFAYRGMQHQSVYGQQFVIDSDLFNALKKHRYVSFVSVNDNNDEYMRLVSNGGFLNLHFRFTEHTQRAVSGEELNESMLFCIDDLVSGKTIFQKHINFSENYFMNIINKTENKDKRQQYLLDIAKEIMPPLQLR